MFQEFKHSLALEHVPCICFGNRVSGRTKIAKIAMRDSLSLMKQDYLETLFNYKKSGIFFLQKLGQG